MLMEQIASVQLSSNLESVQQMFEVNYQEHLSWWCLLR